MLQAAGLINYYGRTPESDNIQIKPVLLQKGRTKVALYGMSNVRDERLFRTFRDGKVKFFQPGQQKSDWFNIMSVHQNHHAYTETGYLPENFLPDFLDFVVWGHEHECLIDPTYNPETSFHVMQPGSSVATSLAVGEAKPKQVAILSVTGRDFKTENIRLKSVRPFVMREIVLQDEPEAVKLAKKTNNRTEVTRFLERIVHEMIDEAYEEWEEAQGEEERGEDDEPPLPLIRLRVENTPPEGGLFECENPQRFSNRFNDKVANVNDVVQFHRKKKTSTRTTASGVELPDQEVLQDLSIDTVRVQKIIKEFLAKQTLTILPQNLFSDAVAQFVDKDDKNAMDDFLVQNLAKQVDQLMSMDNADEDDLQSAMNDGKAKLEKLFEAGQFRIQRTGRKPKPDGWDSDLDGHWNDQPQAIVREVEVGNNTHQDDEGGDNDDDDGASIVSAPRGGRGGRGSRGSRGGRGGRTNATTSRGSTNGTKAAPAAKSRSKKKVVEESDEDDEDIEMPDGDDDESQPGLFLTQASEAPKTRGSKRSAPAPVAPTRRAPTRSTPAANQAPRQSQLKFSQPASKSQTQVKEEHSVEEISDDDDAFEPAPSSKTMKSKR